MPDEIGDLAELRFLRLGLNRLPQLPARVGDLTKLTHLDASQNLLSGSITSWVRPLAANAPDADFVLLYGNACLHVDGDADLEDWLDTNTLGWRDGCPETDEPDQ